MKRVDWLRPGICRLLALCLCVGPAAVAGQPMSPHAAAGNASPATGASATPQAPSSPAVAPQATTRATSADRLTLVAQSDKLVWNGVVVAPDKRVFVDYARIAGNPGPSLAVLGGDGKPVPYPGGGWNEGEHGDAGHDPTHVFVALGAIHLGPDNSLWVLDTGSPGFGKPPLPGAAKLVQIDLTTNSVTRTYVLPPDVLRPKSTIGEVRFHDKTAYLTDAGAPGLIVLDLATGAARRLLDGDPSTTAQRPTVIDGQTLKGPDNKPAMIHADPLEVTPDGKYLYYQPLPGPMFRIPTSLLDDPRASAKAVSQGVEFWYDTQALGGSAIAPDGTLYLDDVENDSVLSLTPDRVLTTVLRDPRLHWPAAPFLADGVLTIPVAQLDRAAVFHHGKSQIVFPVALYSLHVSPDGKARGVAP